MRTERPSVAAKVSIFGQQRPVLLLAWSASAQYVGMASAGTPAETSSLVLGILVNLAATVASS